MHIPGNFHFHDLNKYISAILLPVLLFQNLEVLIVPFTVAGSVVVEDVYKDSNISTSPITKIEKPDFSGWTLSINNVLNNQKWQNPSNSGVKNPLKNVKNTAYTWATQWKVSIVEKISTQGTDSYKDIFDRKWNKKKVRLVMNWAGKTRELITVDPLEVWETLSTKNIIATVSSGTVVLAKDSSIDDPNSFSIGEPTSYDLAGIDKSKIVESFNFGMLGEDIVFSKPVKIELVVGIAEWKLIDLQVRHGNDIDFTRRWLTLNPSATCDPEGNVSIPMTDLYVKWGKVIFYTCGASTFILNASGTGNIKLWLKANAGTSCTTNWCTLSTWSDQSGNSNTGTVTGATTPTYIASRWNFNPAVRCTQTWYFLTVNDGWVAGDMSMVGVYDTVKSAWDATFWNSPAIIGSETSLGQLDYALGMNTGHLIFKAVTGDVLGAFDAWTSNNGTPQIGIGTRTLGGNSLLYRNGRLVAMSASDAVQLTNPTKFGICQHEMASANGYLSGYVMEAIVYSGAISSTNVNKISSYLAIKYGITLDQTTATNYTFSGGAVAWNAAAAWSYTGNIAGIARDDGFSLSQRKSQSASNSGDIIIEYTGSSFATDNNSLVWGNNLWATGTWITTEIPGWFQRIAREWKIQELNWDIGAVNIFMPLSWMANTGGQVVNMIVVGTGTLGDFSGATTFVPGTLSGSSILFNYDFTDGDYITFAIPYTYSGTNQMFWIRANNGSYIDAWVTLATTDGQTIRQWNDNTASAFNMTQATAWRRPIYRKNSLNFNPGLQFTNLTHYLERATGISWTTKPVFTMYFVGSSQKAVWSTGTILGFRNTTAGWYPMITSSLNSFSAYLEAAPPVTSRYTRIITNPNSGIISMSRSSTGVYISSYNGTVATATNAALFTAATTGQPMYLWNRRATPADTNSFSWIMNEVLIYTWVISGTENQKVLSYLACKYGTTLDQTSAYNYLLSNNVVSWNASEDTNYKTNIGCIARDSGFSLYQTGSRSNTNTWDILVEQTGSLTNMTVLSWANNNAATGAWTTTETPWAKIRRFAREWRFQENNGDVGTVKLTYASWSLPSGFTGTLVLVRDNDGVFSSGQVAWSTGTLSWTNWEFATWIEDSEYITFMELGSYDAVDDTISLTEDLTWSLSILSNDTWSSISISRITTLPTNGNLYLSGTTGSILVTTGTTDFSIGSLVYLGDLNYCGADSFVYNMTDTGLLLSRTDSATGTITVNCVNDAPLANGDSLTIAEDASTTLIDIIANDVDVDSGDTISISGIVSTASNGTLTIASATEINYTPDLDFCWVDTFTYQSADLFGPLGSNIATGTITVMCLNDAPTANSNSLTIAEDASPTTLDIISNDTDPDSGDTLSIASIVSTTSNGTLTIASTTEVEYTPDANFCGVDVFTYQAEDTFGPLTSNTATGTITVTCVNDAPVATSDIRTATGTEDTTLLISVLANDTDVDNAITSITGLTQPSTGGTLTLSGTEVLYTPNANFCTVAPLTFTYQARDASGSTSNIATGSFVVDCVNDAPVAVNDSDATMRNTSVLVNVLANDTDSDHTNSDLSINSVTSVTLGTPTISATWVLFTPSAGLCGTGIFTYRAEDASGATSSIATGTVTIACTNSAPTANSNSLTIAEDASPTTLDIISNDTDPDSGDTLSIASIVSTTSNGTLTIASTTEVEYTPDANFCGVDVFTYQAEDTFGPLTSNTATGTITVTCVNDAPVATSDIRTATGTEDTTLLISVLANDTDVDNAITSITGLTQPSTGGTLTLSGTEVLYTPNANFCTVAPLTFTYQARDASGSTSNIATGSFVVDCVNDAPVAVNDSDATMRNTSVLVNVLANDTDSDHTNSDLSINSVTSVTLGTPTISATWVLFTPSAGLCGTGIFTYRAEDASGATSSIATGTVTIACTNSAPTANSNSLTIAEDASPTTLDIISNDTDPDSGDTLSIASIVSTTSNGTLTIASTTEVEYTPDANFCGVDVFTYQAEDTFGPLTSNTATGTITVTCVNDAPVATSDIRTATGTEDTLTLIDVLSNDTDSDHAANQLSLTGLTQPSTGGTLTLSGTEVLYTPNANFCTVAPLTFTYQARDASGSTSNIATGSFVVDCVNDAPVAVNDSDATMRNTSVLVNVLANDTDSDHTNSDLSINSVTSVTLGTPTISATWVLFTPSAGLCGTGIFTYRAEDASGATSSIATGTVTIACTNSAPTANSNSLTIAEDASPTTLDIISNDTDPDSGDTLSIASIVSTTSNGTLTIASTTEVEYTPDANFCGVDVFTYQAEDTFGPLTSNTATGTITVTCVNDAPVATSDIRTATGTEDTTLLISVLANDTDVDNAITSITGLTQPSTGGTLTLSGTEVLYTPNANFCTVAPLTFTYQARDASGSTSNIATGSFVVDCVNDAPVAVNDSDATMRNTSVLVNVLANDTDSDHTNSDLSINSVTSVTLGTPTISATWVLFTPSAGLCGTGIFTYRAEDASGATSSIATGTVTIACTNSAPTANSNSLTIAEDASPTTLDIISNDTDPDSGDTLSIASIVSTTSNGTLTIASTTEVEYTPDANFCGVDVFTYQAEDTFGPLTSNTATGTITVTCVNDAPVATSDIRTATGTEDTTLLISVLANDTDVDNAITSITGLTQPSTGGTLTLSGTEVLYTPNANFCTVAPLTFTYQARDASGSTSNIATGSFVVDCVNDAPVAVNDSDATMRNTSVLVNVLANDTDSDHTNSDLSINSVTSVTLGTPTISATWVLFTPSAGLCGTGIFTYRAEDASGATSSIATGTVTIACTNSAPTANSNSLTIAEDASPTTLDIISNDTDPDSGDTLSIASIVSTTSNGTLTIASTTEVEYTPDANFCGVDVFTYQAEDTFGPLTSNTATGTITVTCVNDAPVATSDIRTATGTEDTTLLISVLANDTDVDNAITSITGLTQPSTGGTLTLSGTEVLYTPNANFCTVAPLTFTYQARDASGSTSNIATGSFVVDCVNDAPVAVNDSDATMRNTSVLVNVLANDTDSDHTNSDLSINSVTSVTLGTPTISATWVLFTPSAGLCGTGIFTYRAEDASGATSSIATGTVTIACTNSAPTANSNSLTIAEDASPTTLDIISNDTDPDSGDTLSIASIVSTTSNGTLTIASTTEVEYTPDANFCGVDVFTYQAEDTFGPLTSNTATGTITVTCVNDAPVATSDIRTATGTEDTTLLISVLANDTDVDNAITSITGLTQPSTGGTLTLSGTEVLYTPNANFCTVAPLTFTYQARDASGSTSNIATGSFVVDCVNDAPVAVNDSDATMRNTSVLVNVLANDTDSDHTNSDLSINSVTSVTLGTPTISATWVLFTPSAGLCGTGIFTYRAEDASGATSSIATGTVTIACTNSAPTANSNSLTIAEDASPTTLDIISNDTDPDSGDTLSIASIVSTTSNGTLTIASTTEVEYTPDANFCGVDVFTYQAEDTFGPLTSNTATGTITVTCVNDAPVATSDIRTATGTEDTTLLISVLANDTDVDNAITSITGLTQPSTGGTLTLSGTEVLYTPNANFCTVAPLTFTYQARDASGSTSNIATGSFVVDCVNDAPVAVNDSDATMRNTSVLVNVLANDTDSDHTNSDLSINSVTSVTLGTPTISATWVLFTPSAGLCGTGIFTYRAEDASGATSSIATGTVTIACTNSAPTANSNSLTIAEDASPTTLDIISNDTDPDSGDTLSIASIVSTTSNGTLTIASTTEVEYTPDANFCGVDVFTYQAEDTFGPLTSNTATGTITVTCVNDAPVATSDIRTATGTEDTTLLISVLANDTDVDNAITSITGLTQPSTGGTLTLSGTEVLYTPNANFCTVAPLTFTYQARDASGSTSNIATGSFVVDCVNDAPVAVNDSDATMRNTSVLVNVLANDTDSDHTNSDLSINSVTSVTLGTPTISATWVLFTPSAGLCGTGIFTYRAEDASGATSSIATGTVTIACTNSAPTANSNSLTIAEDASPTTLDIISNDTDPDSGDTLSIASIVSTTSNGTLTIASTTEVEYTPDANFCGVDVFTYQAEDTFGPLTSNTATGTITVTCVNDAPVATSDIRTATGTEDTTLLISVLANDTDVDNAITSITGLTQPSTGGTLTLSGTEVLYTPNANFCTVAPLTFTYQARDASGSTSNIATGSFVVDCVNDAPVAVNDSDATMRNTSVLVNVLANDTDSDHTNSDLSINSVTSVTLGTPTISATWVLFTPSAGLCGTGIFTYRAEDASGATSSIATGTVTIACTNSAPTANSNSLTIAEDASPTTLDIISNDTDPDSGDTLSIASIVSTTSNGTLTIASTTEVEYTPDANFCGVDVFTYQAEDTFGPLTSNTATGTITVTCVNDAPVATSDIRTATGTEDTTLLISVLANDTDVDNAITSITGLTQPSTGGTLTLSGTEVLYTPNANFCTVAPLTFTYQARDASGSTSNIATGSFVVDCVNDAPVAVNDSDATMRNTSVLVNVLANDTDSDHTNSDLSINSVTSVTLGTPTISATWVLFTPSAGLCGTGIFTYRAEDASGATSSIATGTVTIACTNSAPTANSNSLTIAEDASPTTLDIISNDTDPDSGDTLSIASIVSTTSNGTLTIASTTEVEYTPDANFCGVDVFTYQAEDTFGPLTSNTATGTITVTCVNDAPVATSDIRTATGTEDTTLLISVLANDTDVDNAITSITGLTQPSTGGTLTLSGTEVLYTPNANFCTVAPLTFTYQARDASGSTSNIATGSFVVDCVNDAPVAVNDSDATMRNTSVLVNVLANDTDSDHTNSDLSINSVTSVTLGTPTISATWVLFTPSAGLCGTGIFTYRAEDASGATSSIATGTVTIACTNSAPTANSNSLTIAEDASPTTLDIISNDTDPDSGDTLSIASIVSTTSNGTLTIASTTEVEYTPDANFCGVDVFTYQAEDTFGPLTSNTATGTITVTCVNDAPVATSDIRTATGTEDTLTLIDVLSNDTDSDHAANQLSLTGLTQPSTGGTLTLSGTEVLYTPNANFCTVAPLTFTYQARDASGSTSNIATGSFVVDCVNDAPVAVNDSDATMRNTSVLVNVLANDTDSDHTNSDLSINSVTSVTLGTPTISATWVLFTPSAGLCGTGIFTYRAEDASGATSSIATGTVTIACTNSAPTANSNSLTIAEDASPTTLDIISNDTDPDSGDTLSIASIVSTTSNGTLTIASTTEVEYTPDANFCGVDVFTYQAEDTFGPLTSNTATGTITVTCVNDAPVATSDIRTATGTEDTLTLIDVLSNDTDSDHAANQLSLTGLTQPSTGGTLTLSGTEVLYTPNANFCTVAPLTFTYQARDASGSTSNIATGSFVVDCVPPSIPTLISLGGDVTLPYRISDTTPTFVGTGEANSIINFYSSTGAFIMSWTTDVTGWFLITLPMIFTDASHTITITNTDSMGNESLSILIPFITDSTPPISPTISPTASPSTTGSLIFTWTAESLSLMTVTDMSWTVLCSTSVTSTGYFSCNPLSPALANWTHTLTFTNCDTAYTPNCTATQRVIIVDTNYVYIQPSTSGSNWSSISMPSVSPGSSPSISPWVFSPQFQFSSAPIILNSAPSIFDNNFIKLLPTQTLVNFDSVIREGHSVYNLTDRVTTYVCPQIVQVFKEDQLRANDIPAEGFTDDIKSLLMFRWLEQSEKVIGQTYTEYQKFGIALNDESFEPFRAITRAEFVKMLVRSLSCRYSFVWTESNFDDVDKDMWYAEYITFAVKNGWINGYNDWTFRPNKLITRAEAAKILARAIKLRIPPRTTSSFIDVPQENVFIPYIESLKDKRIIEWKTESTFEPESLIVRSEASRIIYKTFLGWWKKTSR
jgi:hypothetical protein